MFTPEQIEKQLIAIVAKSLQLPEAKVRLEATLLIDLEAESIDILDIRFAIEQAFGFKFDSDEIRRLMAEAAATHKLTERDIPAVFTVGRLYDYILLKLRIKNAIAS
jgi:acyl carrier protein